MFHTEHDDILQKRQDRTISFFDAILAIAITIMALSITFPGLSDVLDKGLDSNFINHLTGYLISFLTLGSLQRSSCTLSSFFSSHYFSRLPQVSSPIVETD